MHVDAVVSFTAVSLEVEFTQLLLLVWSNQLMFKLTLVPLKESEYDVRQTEIEYKVVLFKANQHTSLKSTLIYFALS